MNRRQQDREFRKQLLLVKGDALRMQAGVQLARLFGQMRPDQQRAMLDIAKIVVSASAHETMAAA